MREIFQSGVHRKGKGTDGCAWLSIWTPHIEMHLNNLAAKRYSHHAAGKWSVRGTCLFATGISCSAYAGVSIRLAIGEHPRGERQHCRTRRTSTVKISGRATILTISHETGHDCGQGAARRAAGQPHDNHGTTYRTRGGTCRAWLAEIPLPSRPFMFSVSSSLPVFSWRKYPGGGESGRALKSYTATRPTQELHR